jgi:hypothetical protein
LSCCGQHQRRRCVAGAGLPERLHVHYVSQEVTLTAEQEESLPVHVIIEADVERSMLLEEVAKAEATPEAADPVSAGS